MSYSVHVEQFEGPLDLLLQLIEGEKLDITSISLQQVCEPFVAHVREHQGKIPPEELADFLIVAAKLVYLKSRALLPELTDPSLEEGPNLEAQLRMYKQFVEVANRFGEMTKGGIRSFGRNRRTAIRQFEGFIAPTGVTASVLSNLYQNIIRRLEPIIQLPKAAVARIITIEDKIQELRERITRGLKTTFHRFVSGAKDRGEVIVSFLALLELIKQRVLSVRQKDLFEDIHLETI